MASVETHFLLFQKVDYIFRPGGCNMYWLDGLFSSLGLLHWLVVLLQRLCFCTGLGCAPLVRPDRRPGGSGVCGQ